MSDDVVIAKAAIIGRCVRRAREERAAAGAGFATDFTRQDAAILNVERACEAAIDIAFRLTRIKGLGAPAASRQPRCDRCRGGGRVRAYGFGRAAETHGRVSQHRH
ncbi:MAG: DUF86 domain-containing protein, partial [Hyphomonadaceae bacterium]|nr:DUF86 domain-containing protein [Hyphomonadaceae bacterium]